MERKYLYETHLHTAGVSACGASTGTEMARFMKKSGFDGIFVTDHFVGGNTAGTSGQPLFIQLESGGVFRVCTRRCLAQNGEDIYNKGFSPDIRMVSTFADFSSGRDSAYEKGLEIIKDKLNN